MGVAARTPDVRNLSRTGAAVSPVDRRPLWRLLQAWPWGGWLVAATVALRLVAVVGLRLQVYFDSPEYDALDLTGRSRRPWATPLLYRIVPGGDDHLVMAQAVVGASCWAALALSAAAWFRLPASRVAVAVGLAALGCTTSVTNWDTAKLSESLAISLTVLVIAAWLNLLRRPTAATGVSVLLATVPWLFVRHGVMASAVLVAAGVVVGAFLARRRTESGRTFAAVAVAMVALVVLASVSYGRNPEIVQQNLTGIVAARVAPHPDRVAWFVAHDMPVPASGRLDYRSLRRDAAFGRWAAGDGWRTYLRYLASHPREAATGPMRDMVDVRRSPGDAQAKDVATLSPSHAYGSARPVLPDLLEGALFPPGRTGSVLLALGAVAAGTVALRRHRHRGWIVPLGVVGISLASFFASWNGSVPEQARHAIVSAVALHVGLVLQLAMLTEGEVVARRRPGSGPGGHGAEVPPEGRQPVGARS